MHHLAYRAFQQFRKGKDQRYMEDAEGKTEPNLDMMAKPENHLFGEPYEHLKYSTPAGAASSTKR